MHAIWLMYVYEIWVMSVIWVFYETVKITWNHFVLNIIFFSFQKLVRNFFWIYNDGKSKLLKSRYWKKILKQYAKEPTFQGKE